VPRTKKSKRKDIIQRNRTIARGNADAGKTVDGEQLEPYIPIEGREFVPRNQRNMVRDKRGALRNHEDIHDELRRLNP
jgi:hypothetical protein